MTEEKIAAEKPKTAETKAKQRVSAKELKARIAELEESLAGANDRYVRAVAEMDNARKRSVREKEDALKYKNESIGKDLVKIVDDFERCVAAAGEPETDREASMLRGIKLMQSKFVAALEANSIAKMAVSEGDEFTTDMHEAVAMAPAGDEMKGRVVSVVESGYTVAGKVLRYAKVVVGQ